MQIYSIAHRVTGMAKRRPLTPEEAAAAARANALWQKKKRAKKLTQPDGAAAIGISTSGFNQYINGKIPLNTDTTAALAKYFHVNPRDIDPGWLQDAQPGAGSAELDAEFERLTQVIDGDQDMAAIRAIAGRVSPKGAIMIARLFLDRAEAGL